MENILTDDIKDFLYVRKGDFHKKYAPLDGRYSTMRAALNLYLQRNGRVMVETGCQRVPNDWGAGNSTTVFCDFLNKHKGHLYTVDNNAHNLNVAKEVTQEFDNVTYTLDNSVTYLANFNKPIDLLYLDSFDYPHGELLNFYGGKVDIVKARADLEAVPHDEVVDTYSHIISACQEHCVDELMAALPNLHQKSIILIDDNDLPGGGKPRLAREWLLENNWEVILDQQQTLWIQH